MTKLSSRPAELASPGRKRKFKWGQATLGTLLLVSVVWLGLYLKSDAFRDLVRRKVIAQLELVTGGKVEIQSFSWKLSGLQFEARGVTIHGMEASDQAPLIHADRIAGQAKIISFFRTEIGLRSLVIDHPVIHLIVYADGTTNQPMLRINKADNSQVQRLFAMAIDRAEFNNAELLLNEKKLPFDFSGNHLSGGMSYSKADKNYEGNFSIDLVAAHYRNFEPVHGTLDLHFLLRPAQFELKALKFTVDRSVLQASGTLTNFNHPEVHAQYSASLDLKEAGRIARIPQLRAGQLEVSGSANYGKQLYETQGTLAAHNVEWRDSFWSAAGVDVATPFLFTSDKIGLPRLVVRAFGGTAEGQVQVVNWNARSSTGKKAERGSGILRLSKMQVGQLASAISSSKAPLNKINLVGTVSGEVSST